jgi:hypothetical protein
MDDTTACFNTLPRKFQNHPKMTFTCLSEGNYVNSYHFSSI